MRRGWGKRQRWAQWEHAMQPSLDGTSILRVGMNKNLPRSKVFNIGKGQKARLWLWVQRNLNFSSAGNFAYCSWSKAKHVLCLPNMHLWCKCWSNTYHIMILLSKLCEPLFLPCCIQWHLLWIYCRRICFGNFRA